jgi:tetratricopeptide (TPR) repeat protein
LAYYHYFYKVIPGMVRSSKTPMFYTQKGLNKNPNSLFLRDIKAKLLLEEGKDTAAFQMFEVMWNETKDPTYYWDLTWIQIARGRMVEADSMITVALGDANLKDKKVAMEHIQAQLTERVSTEAAFLFLKYQLAVANRNIMQGAEFLQKALEIEPNFYAARRSIMDLQRMSAANR